jgi:Tol biopolymer transport system component
LTKIPIDLYGEKENQTVGYTTPLDRSNPIEFTLGNKGRDLKFSPDRTLVVYSFTETVEDELRSSLWLYDLNSGEEKRLILWPEKLTDTSLTNPNFYPDGNKLIFSIRDIKANSTSLGSINLDGTEIESINTPSRTLSTGPVLSPDGEKILVLCEGVDKDSGQPGFMLCIMDKDGSNRLRLTEQGDFHGTYMFSPDSQTVIYSESEWGGILGLFNPPRYEIKQIDINGKNVETILEWHRAVNVMALSTSGTEIIFMDRYDEKEHPGLYMIDITGENLRHLAYFDEFLADWYSSD